MFNNKFLKNDPLLEAVKAARADGDARRLAESMANDLFGVYSRKAVVREHLSDYDYALEEAYKCMKEEDKMADKDYDRDGKIETSKKEVWGSRLRAAKASGKYKGPVDEKKMWEGSGVSGEDPGMEVAKQAGARQQAQTPSSTPARTGNAAGATIAKAKDALNEATRKHFRQHAADIAKISDQGERNKAASAAADTYARLNPRFDHAKFHAAAGSTAHQEPKKMEEAAYSAKAAREGKDIGKPGKMFSKIAKKAGEKYGSEERGKKVAGAILAKIRAKHMKEEQGF